MLNIIIVLVAGYLLGSIATGVVLSEVFAHADVRTMGSGNAGTTNMLRVFGRSMALFTFLGDTIKGIIAVYIGKWLVGGELGGILGTAGAVLGHYYPLYFGFRGGKGIATAFGSLLFIFPIHALIAFGVFLVLVAATKYVSLGSVCAALTLPALLFITHGSSNLPVCLIAAAIGISIVLRHHKNISRLLNHTENKLDLNKLLKKKS